MWLLYHFIRFEFILKGTHFLFDQLIRTIKEFEPPTFGINKRLSIQWKAIYISNSRFNIPIEQTIFIREIFASKCLIYELFIGKQWYINVKFIFWLHEMMYSVHMWLSFNIDLISKPYQTKTALYQEYSYGVFEVQFIVKVITRNATTWIQLIKWFLLPNFSSSKFYHKIQEKFQILDCNMID